MTLARSWRAPARGDVAAQIGCAVIRALYREIALYPKPGLVSPVDSGAHDDMDFGLFMRSLFALRAYFRDVAAAGARGAGFEELRQLGVAAERQMLRATGGVNTHRGAIFTLGLLAAAAGALSAEGGRIDGASLADAIRARWGADILPGASANAGSNGARALRAHGGPGAREEAAAGFPLLFEVALPTLETTFARTGNADSAAVQTLFAIMARLNDTNLLHRGGRAGLEFARRSARDFLSSGGVETPRWRARAVAIHRGFVARNLSPGGGADMLAAALFVEDARRLAP